MSRDIVEFIKGEMTARGMTYELLAEKSGMTKQNLWMKLNCKTRPSMGTIRKILNGLGYDFTIKKINGATDEETIRKFLDRAAEEQTVSFESIRCMVEAVGYELQIETHKNEEEVKKGIDNQAIHVKI